MEERRDRNRKSRIESDFAQAIDNERKNDSGRKIFSYIDDDVGKLSFTENKKGKEAF